MILSLNNRSTLESFNSFTYMQFLSSILVLPWYFKANKWNTIPIGFYSQYWVWFTHTLPFAFLTVPSCDSVLPLNFFLCSCSFSESLLMRNPLYLMSESVFINVTLKVNFACRKSEWADILSVHWGHSITVRWHPGVKKSAIRKYCLLLSLEKCSTFSLWPHSYSTFHILYGLLSDLLSVLFLQLHLPVHKLSHIGI